MPQVQEGEALAQRVESLELERAAQVRARARAHQRHACVQGQLGGIWRPRQAPAWLPASTACRLRAAGALNHLYT